MELTEEQGKPRTAASITGRPTGGRPSLWWVLTSRSGIVLLALAVVVTLVYGFALTQYARRTAVGEARFYTEVIQSNFSDEVAGVEAIERAVAEAWSRGDFSIEEPIAAAQVLRSYTRNLRRIEGLLVAALDGRTVALQRDVVNVVEPTDGGSSRGRVYRFTSDGGVEGAPSAYPMRWDARLRPWFVDAMPRRSAAWVPAYNSIEGFLCLTYSGLVYAPAGAPLGVIALDYTLVGLSAILQSALPTPRTQAVLLDASAQVIAFAGVPGQAASNNASTLALRTLPNPAFPNFVGPAIREHRAGAWRVRNALAGDRLLVARDFSGVGGQRWRLLVSLPERDLTHRSVADVTGPMLILFGFFALAVWLIGRTARHAVQPLVDLALWAGDPGHPDAPRRPASQIREFRVLEESVQRSWEEHLERLRLREQVLHLDRVQMAGTLASGIVHDTRNLLHAAQAGLDCHMQATQEGRPDAADDLEMASSAIDRAAGLLSSLVDFCRRVQGERQRFDLADRIANLRPILSAILGRSIALELDLHRSWVLGSAVQMEQLVINLVLNARDAMEGTGRVTIRVAPTASGAARLDVEDDGPGIPPEVIGRIFEPFFTTKEAGGGTGLGLAMSFQIATDHGGRLEVRNRPEGGAVFSLTLPAAPPEEDDD